MDLLPRSLKAYFESSLADVCDLNYDLSNPHWRQLARMSHKTTPALLEGLARLAYFTAKSCRPFKDARLDSPILFLVGTANNYATLAPIVERLDGAKIVGFHRLSKPDVERVRGLGFYLRGIVRLWKLLGSYLVCRDAYVRWTMRKRLDRYVLALAAVDCWARLFRRWRPKVVVLSNDHSVWPRAALKAARREGIATVFIPHAPTGDNPAPMEFDYALLDGETQSDAYDYEHSKIILCGAVRYQHLVNLESNLGDGVLVCFNKLDSMEDARTMVRSLRASTGTTVRIRPHPADDARTGEFERIAREEEVEYVAGTADFEKAAEGTRFLLAGVSGVHVDGLMVGMVPVTLDHWYEGDYYGLKRLGLLLVLQDCSDIGGIDESDLQRVRQAAIKLNVHLARPRQMPLNIVVDCLQTLSDGGVLDDGVALATSGVSLHSDPVKRVYAVR